MLKWSLSCHLREAFFTTKWYLGSILPVSTNVKRHGSTAPHRAPRAALRRYQLCDVVSSIIFIISEFQNQTFCFVHTQTIQFPGILQTRKLISCSMTYTRRSVLLTNDIFYSTIMLLIFTILTKRSEISMVTSRGRLSYLMGGCSMLTFEPLTLI